MNPPPLLALFAGAAALATLPAQESSAITARVTDRTVHRGFDRVLHDEGTHGLHHAGGSDWKASFGRDGFTFIPFLGADAERNHPVRFHTTGARVGGQSVPIDTQAAPTRHGDRITFDRGALREHYDLSLHQVAQSFVLFTELPGDVEIELRVATELTELTERADEPGIRFGNTRGGVAYSQAFLLRDGQKLAIESTWDGESIRLRVAASLRGDGPVVIDPIASTFLTGFAPTFTRPNSAPDIAFDATGNVYMAVWESHFSVNDIDMLCEMFDGDGNLIAGSGAVLDLSSLSYSQPSIGDCNASNRFLVAMTKVDPFAHQGRSMIVGRTRDANPAAPLSGELLISEPTSPGSGNHSTADVGGNSGAVPDAFGFAVVWTYVTATGNSVVRRRFYSPAGAAASPDVQLLGGPKPLHSPRISSSNGRDHVSDPSWLVVISSTNGPNDVDVMGILLTDPNLPILFFNLDNDFDDDRYPSVSSPVGNLAGNRTWFLVTYEQQSPAAAKAILYDATLHVSQAQVDLTQAFGFGAFWVRAESDGVRFAVTATDNAAATSIGIGTLAYDGFTLSPHENLRTLPGAPTFPRLTSKYAGGGPATDYAVAYVDGTVSPARTRVGFYNGYQPGVQIAQHTLACDGLALQWAGQPLLTRSMQFTLSSFGNDIPAIGFGFPAPTPIALCANCSLGLRLDQPILLTLGASLSLPIPPNVTLVGSTFAIQGVSIGQNACLGALSLSDMLELTIR